MKQHSGNMAIGAISILSLALVAVAYLWWSHYQQNATLASDNTSLQERLKNSQTEMVAQTQALSNEESQSFRLQHLLQKATDENQQLKQQLTDMQVRHEELVTTHSSLEEQLSSSQQSSAQQHQVLLQEQLAAFTTEKEQWFDDQQASVTQVSQLKTELKRSQELVVELQQDWENNKRQADAEMQSLQKKHDALTSEKETLSTEKKALFEQQKKLALELAKTKKQLNSIKAATVVERKPLFENNSISVPAPVPPVNKLPEQELPKVTPVMNKSASS